LLLCTQVRRCPPSCKAISLLCTLVRRRCRAVQQSC
jgi:hypothetical protein